MLSESVYNYASRRGAADQDSGSQFEAQAQLQLASIQKPRNKRKNFKPISSRMAEVSDESDREESERDDEDEEDEEDETMNETAEETQNSNEVLEFERKPMLLLPPPLMEERPKQRLNNNESSPMDLSVSTRPPSSDDESGDSFKHKFIIEQLRSQKVYSPSAEVCFK